MIKYLIGVLISLALIITPFFYLAGHPIGALPMLTGIFLFICSLGRLIGPLVDRMFKEE